MNERLPAVCHITDLAPANPATFGPLSYRNLASAALRYEHAEAPLLSEVWHADNGSMEERNAAENAASAYLTRISHHIITASTPAQHDLWAQRFNQGSIEIYGQPDVSEAKTLIHDEQLYLLSYQSRPDVDQRAVDYLLDFYSSVVGEPDHTESSQYNSLWPRIVEFVNDRFAPLIDIIDEVCAGKEQILPVDSKLILESMIKWMADSHSPTWARWRVKEKNDAIMAAYPETEEFSVGKLTPPCSPAIAKGGAFHEMLHALRAIIGMTSNEHLRLGLAQFRTFDEGFATLFEWALSGIRTTGAEMHYRNIALALGSIDGNPVSRSKLLGVEYKNSKLHWQASGGRGLFPLGRRRGIAAQTTRISRGGRGDNFGTIQPVFTKDMVYHEGYRRAERYIQRKLDEGRSMGEIFNMLNMWRVRRGKGCKYWFLG